MTIMHSDDDKTSNLSMEALRMLVFSKQRRFGSGTPISAATSWLCPKNFEDLAALVASGEYVPGKSYSSPFKLPGLMDFVVYQISGHCHQNGVMRLGTYEDRTIRDR
jgi:hypothetical protein